MNKDDSGPLAVFGIRIKSIVVAVVFITLIVVVINRSEIDSLLRTAGIGKQQTSSSSRNPEDPSSDSNHLVVDQEMLSRAMQEVQVEKLEELESQDSTIVTDRFFYIVELVSGGDLEGVDLTIEPDQVILISAGGTRTTIKPTAVKNIHRFKLPPSKKE